MPTPLPDTTAAWLREIRENLEVATMAAVGEGLDEAPDPERWVAFMQGQALALSQAARGLDQPAGSPEQQLDELDAVDDLAQELRTGVPGDRHDRVSEAQLFLLFYLAAHVHAQLLDRDRAKVVVRGCWAECADDEADGADSPFAEADNEPWPVTHPSPATAEAWVAEIIEAYGRSNAPPPLPLSDRGAFRAANGSLLEAATAMALASRGVKPTGADVKELIDTIRMMEDDISGMGPEWEAMQDTPALAFAMFYLWVHLAIGAADADRLIEVVRACTECLADFPDPGVHRSTRRMRHGDEAH
jgi:hypothetical protein